ncbi:hypothetical protein RMATCC62417_13222 [Rhizopus microsporus]|nr:hypothetical protein RMATCC62417_13222 [Rhizopus microsporus]
MREWSMTESNSYCKTIYKTKATFAVALLFCSLVNGYKPIHCDNNGCTPDKPVLSLASMSQGISLPPVATSVTTLVSLKEYFGEDAIAQVTLISRRASYPGAKKLVLSCLYDVRCL